MRQLVFCDVDLCVGCNRCVRNCPIETANIVKMDGAGNVKVDIDASRCIACGGCIDVCRHGARDYTDDLELFLSDLRRGARISVMIAPAIRANRDDLGKLIAWLREQGADKVYDVSLGADLCIWGHIRYVQRHMKSSIITQPCPAIVDYIQKYRQSLLQYLSPVQSPMGCTAVYIKKYESNNSSIAAISPCIAKTHEFESTGLIKYNVTFQKLFKYMEDHGISLPNRQSDFDHYQCGLGSVFSMPGGLKENMEFFLGKSLRIDKAEGIDTIYGLLDEYEYQDKKHLPDIFDVLNCGEGCNMGSGVKHSKGVFEVGFEMEKARRTAVEQRDKAYFESLYKEYDSMFRLEDFLRNYIPTPVRFQNVTDNDIERAFLAMGKETDIQRTFDCSACGSNSCDDMARKIALHVNIPENCLQSARENSEKQHRLLEELHEVNVQNATKIEEDIDEIKDHVERIAKDIGSVNDTIDGFSVVEQKIDEIASMINIIAINASIEAARAGQYGQTFGVIAEEIQKLAKASQDTINNNHELFVAASSSVGDMNTLMKEILEIVTVAHSNILEINRANISR